MTPVVRVALAAMSFHLPQDQVTKFIDDCRRCLTLPTGGEDGTSRDGECLATLVVDEFDSIHDLARLATHVDVLSFSPHRRGFGRARSTALQEARIANARWAIIVDADGQHDPHAIARVLEEAERSSWTAVVPQRTLVDLPLFDEGDLDRKLAERFESYFVARAAGRPELHHLDTQPGLFLFRREALDLLIGHMESEAYSWDLEAAWRLLTSGLELGFPHIDSRPQATSFFSTADSLANVRFLCSIAGADAVRTELASFREQAWVQDEFRREAVEALVLHVQDALEGDSSPAGRPS